MRLGAAPTLIQDNQLRDSYSGVGFCSPGFVVFGLSRKIPPSCVAVLTPAPTSTATSTFTPTSTATFTPTPTPTSTFTPSPTPTPVACTVALYKGQVPASNSILLRYTFNYACNFVANMTGSNAHLVDAPAAEDDYPVGKGTGSGAQSSIGTVNCASGVKNCTFNSFSATSFAAGDYIEVDAPNPADTTADGLYITFLGSKP